MQPDLLAKSLLGLLITLGIIVLWVSSLAFLLSIDIAQLLPWGILPAILGRTFLQTGLFIVAHDAIHGSLLPNVGTVSSLQNRRLNDRIGQLAAMLYALLSYQKLALNHLQHHRYPGQASDPDFHDGIHQNIFAWYLKFMQEYLDNRQKVVLFLGMGVIFLTLYLGFHIPVINLFLFWVLPIGLSSIQLFVFGTYLPHRSPSVGSTESDNTKTPHQATSSNYPLLWSFLTCYHFGYHWEHHQYPFLPWYSLPSVHRNREGNLPQSRLMLTFYQSSNFN